SSNPFVWKRYCDTSISCRRVRAFFRSRRPISDSWAVRRGKGGTVSAFRVLSVTMRRKPVTSVCGRDVPNADRVHAKPCAAGPSNVSRTAREPARSYLRPADGSSERAGGERWVDGSTVNLLVVAVAELVQREARLHRVQSALAVLRGVAGLLGKFQGEEGLVGDPCRHVERERAEFVTRDDVVDHAQLECLRGSQRFGCEEHLLGLADAYLPGMVEELGAADAHHHGVVDEDAVVCGDDQIAGPDEH